MSVRKQSLGGKILKFMLAISLAGLIVCMGVGILNILSVRRIAVDTNENLGEEAADYSEEALIEQMEKNIQTLAENKSSANAASTLEQYLGTIQNLSDYISNLYRSPESYLPREVKPPQELEGGVFTLQRYTTTGTPVESVAEEVGLLGNVQPLFDSVIRNHQNVVTTIYLATESGILLSYDDKADLAESEYYDFQDTEWYLSAKVRRKPLYTDAYMDAYGRGLTTTCAAPFYGADNQFMGVVCIDILLEDIRNEIIQVDVSENSVGYLVDGQGNIIAGPDVDYSSDEFSQLGDLRSGEAFQAASVRMLNGFSGVEEVDEIFYAFSPIDYVNWSLIIEVPRSDIIQPVTEMRGVVQEGIDGAVGHINQWIRWGFVVFFVVLVASVIGIYFTSVRLSDKLIAPLRSVQRQVRVVSQGNLDAMVEVVSDDEIGDLARDFNHMALSLKEYIREIQEVTAEKERIGAELSVATQIQTSMLPCIFPAFPERDEFDVYATMEAAKEVGGDFYDFFLIDRSHLGVVMADVSGKGVPAALFMVIAKTLIKNHAQAGLAPYRVFEVVNDQLCENNEAGMFVTAFMGILEISTGIFTYVNAGHNPPLLSRKGGEYEWLPSKRGFVLAGMEEMKYKQQDITMEAGDCLYLYTDGVTEALNPQEELYSEQRLLAVMNAIGQGDPDPVEVLHGVRKDIEAFADGAEQADDITMLMLKVNTGGRKNG